ncbi:hypothetical protein RRG08_018418 [Elysia crispata]|uniref:Uncharacterized protein n=1 Tax=Elysia crispata TaxID=231223 RepID=A0AAE0XQV9_9GAST|nr:hypothetical protein RRG08_018418 [Elysia crispata]
MLVYILEKFQCNTRTRHGVDGTSRRPSRLGVGAVAIIRADHPRVSGALTRNGGAVNLLSVLVVTECNVDVLF